jgi:hypothetical protein
MSTKSHAHMRSGTLRKSSISTRGYAEIHIQRLFFDNKKSIWKILRLKIQTVETCSSACSIHRNFSAIFHTSKQGSKIKLLSWNFLSKCKGSICTCSKNFWSFWFFWNLCGISKVALPECEWLIFKLHFGLDNDLFWISASLIK